MKKLVAAVVLSLMTMSVSFAGENPKLLKEIKRKFIEHELMVIKNPSVKSSFDFISIV